MSSRILTFIIFLWVRVADRMLRHAEAAAPGAEEFRPLRESREALQQRQIESMSYLDRRLNRLMQYDILFQDHEFETRCMQLDN